MRVRLLHRDRDADLQRPLPWNAEALVKDLGLDVLFHAMAKNDGFLLDVARRVVLSGAGNEIETIRYRQGILQDSLNHPAVVRDLYAVAVEATEYEKKQFLGSTLMRYPDWVLRRSIEMSEEYLCMLRRLRTIADSNSGRFASEGWTALFATLKDELSDEYFAGARDHVEQLKFRDGMLLGARLGKGNKTEGYTLHVRPRQRRRTRWQRLRSLLTEWLDRLFARRPPVPGFSLDPRDESGARALRELQGRGIAGVANALAQSTDHVRGFFGMLRWELAFYVGCVNLHKRIARKRAPVCIPVPAAATERRLSFRGLYDICLCLSVAHRVVGNEADADRQDLVVVTGANQGGKSTFLRSIGLAQLMMQCGMFAPADSFRSSVYDGLFTHFKREEDTAMKSGKLDEELSRMSEIVDHITSRSMVLFNESFAATNEREGSEIARQILSALLERRVKGVYVTHLYELADGLRRGDGGNILFLRADREADGTRTFKLTEGRPLQTSFGEDLYADIFGIEADRSGAAEPTARAGTP